MKYCERCNAPLDDSAEQCNQCGAPVKTKSDDFLSDPFAQSMDGESADESSIIGEPVKSKNIFPFVIGGVVVLTVIAIIITTILLSGNNKPIENAVDLINDKTTSIDELAEVALPEFAYDVYEDVVEILNKSGEFKSMMSEAKSSIKDLYKEMDSQFGKDWKISFEKKDKTDLTKDELREIEDSYHSLYNDMLKAFVDQLDDMDDDALKDMSEELEIKEKDAKKLVKEIKEFAKQFKNCEISSGYTLKGYFKIKGKDDSETSDTLEINIIKINGDWTIDYLSILSELGADIEDLF